MAAISVPALASATQLVSAGQFPEANTLLERYCAQHPDDVHGVFLLALTRRETGNLSGAEQAIGTIPPSLRAPIHHLAGLIARDLGAYERAAVGFRRALLCDPEHPGAWQGLAGLQVPGSSDLSRYAAAAAVVDPSDAEAWTDLIFASLVGDDSCVMRFTRHLLPEALKRGSDDDRRIGEAIFGSATGGASGPLGYLETDEAERGVARLVEQATVRFRDHPRALAILARRLRCLAVSAPHARAPWLADLVLHSRAARPGDGALLRRVGRVVAFGQLHASTAELTQSFAACVAAKRFAMATPAVGAVASAVGHALGLRALCESVDRPIGLLWRQGHRRVTIGDRAIGYRLSSPSVSGFVAKLFLFEPGLWRWMAGFEPDDTLLDIGANVGIYTIAAAGLFGVRVAALEPYAPNLQTLRHNVAANRLGDRVTVLPFAATDTERTGRLFHEGGGAGAAAQHFEGEADAGATDESFTTVEGVPVDLLVERGTIPFPTRIKIDVDGNEGAVIGGMLRTLADPRLHSLRLEVRWRQPDGRAVVERVQSFGFRATVDDDQKNLLFTRVPSHAKTR